MLIRNVLLGTCAAALSLTAMANSITVVDYDLSHPIGNLGKSHVYGPPGDELTISGFMTNVVPNYLAGTWKTSKTDHDPTSLYGKFTHGKPGESGLGMLRDPNHKEHEIWDQLGAHERFGFLMMDLGQLEANPNLLSFQLGIESAQGPNELYTIWGSTAADRWSATLLKTGVGGSDATTGFFDVPNFFDYRYIWIGAEIRPGSHARHSDVLVDSRASFSNAPPVPEPSTFALLGSGLLTAGFSLRRRFGKAKIAER